MSLERSITLSLLLTGVLSGKQGYYIYHAISLSFITVTMNVNIIPITEYSGPTSVVGRQLIEATKTTS